jgi:hypothetical protein
MTPTFIADAVQVVTDTYGASHVRTALDAGRTLVRIDDLELYEGCKPLSTPMLLVLDPGQPKPLAYVRPGQLLANGKTPKSTSPVLVGGESWMQFSFNVPWEEPHGIVRFIAAARQRFGQHE